MDERDNVVGVVSAKLRAITALTTSGALPRAVNCAFKSSFLLRFLGSLTDRNLLFTADVERLSPDF